MIITIILPVALCGIIVIGFIFDYLKFTKAQEISQDVSTVIIENIYNHESLALSLIGIAISVWIGLNIYNTISKEELQVLLDSAKKAEGITEQIYIEMLKSKFRVLASSTPSEYFAIQLGQIGQLPVELSEKILELEDVFYTSYCMYGNGISTGNNQKGVLLAARLEELTEYYNVNKKISIVQFHFLIGYISWRWGDFLYFQAKYNKYSDSERTKDAKNAIERYKDAGRYLFAIQDIATFRCVTINNQGNDRFLAYLANDIASTYIDLVHCLSLEQLKEAIAVELVAVELSADLADNVKEKFLRNLGVAYEKRGELDKAFKQYQLAYKCDPSNWKIAHCIGSCYRKQAISVFYPDLSPQELAQKNLSTDLYATIKQLPSSDIDKLIDLLKRALYWYTIKQGNYYSQSDERLVEINDFLYQLTWNKVYEQNAKCAKEYHCFSKEVVNC